MFLTQFCSRYCRFFENYEKKSFSLLKFCSQIWRFIENSKLNIFSTILRFCSKCLRFEQIDKTLRSLFLNPAANLVDFWKFRKIISFFYFSSATKIEGFSKIKKNNFYLLPQFCKIQKNNFFNLFQFRSKYWRFLKFRKKFLSPPISIVQQILKIFQKFRKTISVSYLNSEANIVNFWKFRKIISFPYFNSAAKIEDFSQI